MENTTGTLLGSTTGLYAYLVTNRKIPAHKRDRAPGEKKKHPVHKA
jgi:hypothetical protein